MKNESVVSLGLIVVAAGDFVSAATAAAADCKNFSLQLLVMGRTLVSIFTFIVSCPRIHLSAALFVRRFVVKTGTNHKPNPNRPTRLGYTDPR